MFVRDIAMCSSIYQNVLTWKFGVLQTEIPLNSKINSVKIGSQLKKCLEGVQNKFTSINIKQNGNDFKYKRVSWLAYPQSTVL